METNFEKLIDNHVTPTLFSLCESICYTNETPCRITKLAENTRATIFDFDYPLTDKINKEQFEINIINHFLMRRIGQETFTAFQLVLSNKLNEIMPYYNKLFEALDGWELLQDGDITERTLKENGKATTNTETNIKTNTVNEQDNRYSDMPDNHIDYVKSGEYLTNYTLNKDTAQSSNDTAGKGNTTNENSVEEKVTHTPADKMSIYKEFFDNQKSIFTKLYKELEVCFYGLYE